MVQNQWYHFGDFRCTIVVYFRGDWDVHGGYGSLTHAQLISANRPSAAFVPCPLASLASGAYVPAHPSGASELQLWPVSAGADRMGKLDVSWQKNTQLEASRPFDLLVSFFLGQI